MIAIDTNVLVRYITQDNLEQYKKSVELLESYKGIAGSIFVNNVVLCEMVWVLERGYKYSRNQILSTINFMASTHEFAFENHGCIWLALENYETSKVDFSDCLIAQINLNHGYKNTFTFDRQASESSNFCLL